MNVGLPTSKFMIFAYLEAGFSGYQYYSGRKMSLAIGIATASFATNVDALSNEADKAMFAAKTRFYEDAKVERRR